VSPRVPADIDGQPRAEKTDAGCDQVSDAPVLSRPLTPADVGPAWLKR
jgi:poly(beta-D-mannuronate) lyase